MPPEEELASALHESKLVNRQAVDLIRENLLLRMDLQHLLRQAESIRRQVQQTRESALLVRDDANRKRSALSRTLRSAVP